MRELIERMTIIAVGVGEYEDDAFRTLYGPEVDIENLFDLLVANEDTALFSEDQFIELYDPTKEELEDVINDYIESRSAVNDILLFYFSGHGVPVGRGDFGFCTTDTRVHAPTNVPYPMSVVKYRDVLRSLSMASIIPIFIIDSCFSGIAGEAHVTPVETIGYLRDNIHLQYASKYGLFCACSNEYFTDDTPYGGEFSIQLVQAAIEGIESNNPDEELLSIQDIHKLVSNKLERIPFLEAPRIFVGQSLQRIPFVINTQYKLKTHTLSPTYVRIIDALWNDGNPVSLSPKEIGDRVGYGGYCNHNKLSFSAWNLVETINGSRNRQLTHRGKLFAKGELAIPYRIVYDPRVGGYVRAENSEDVMIDDERYK